MRYILAVAALLSLSFVLHLINLKAFPLYLDEGLYIYWASLFAVNPGNAYISLLDGKTPLFMWLTALTNQYLHDYLFTSRLLSVIGGSISAFCWSQIIRITTNAKTSLFFIVLIMLTPYTYLVERMAFVDSAMTAFASIAILLVCLSQKLFVSKFRSIGIMSVIFAGICLSVSYMIKSSATMFLYLATGLLIYWSINLIRQQKFTLILLNLISTLIIILTFKEMTSYIKVGGYRYWSSIQTKETQLSYTLPEVFSNLQHGHQLYFYHANYLFGYFYAYLGPLLLLAIFGGVLLIKQRQQSTWLLVYSLVITFGIFFSAKAIASRYFYPITFPLVGLASIGLSSFWASSTRLVRQFILIASVLLILPVSLLIFWPVNAFYAFDDQSYFASGDITALGLSQSIPELISNPEDTIVGVYGIWGVSEGTQTILAQHHVETVILGEWITMYSRDKLSDCPMDQKLLGEFCYKLTLGPLLKSSKRSKYLYLTRESKYQSVDLLKQLIPLQIRHTFLRPYGDSRVYLIKIL